MMYAQKFAVAVKVNGKVLREHGDQVTLPFGSEYTITLKNLNSVRALVRIEIDGKDMTEGCSLIVPPNESIDVERSIKNGNMNVGHRFKFIERTASIEEHRGIEVEDGLIRVEYEFERETVAVPAPVPVPYVKPYLFFTDQIYKYDRYYGPMLIGSGSLATAGLNATSYAAEKGPRASSGVLRAKSVGEAEVFSTSAIQTEMYCSAAMCSDEQTAASQSLAGITVDGSVSSQEFKVGSWFPTDSVKHAMVLKLVGQIGSQPVTAPVTVKTKLECPSCGHKNNSRSKFCTECGTGLVIV